VPGDYLLMYAGGVVLTGAADAGARCMYADNYPDGFMARRITVE
jgi:hypothetical protein